MELILIIVVLCCCLAAAADTGVAVEVIGDGAPLGLSEWRHSRHAEAGQCIFLYQ